MKICISIVYGLFRYKKKNQIILVIIVLELDHKNRKENSWLYVLKSYSTNQNNILKRLVTCKKTDMTDITDMNNKQQKIKLWKYMWTTKEFWKSILSELNAKRISFVSIMKICFEVVLLAKLGPEKIDS